MKNLLPIFDDRLLTTLVSELVTKHKCHTVVLYGSRARGDFTSQSDYDLMGVRKSGKTFRVAEKRQGLYADIFIFPEKDLKRVDEHLLYMNGGKVLYEQEKFGTTFLRKLEQASKRKFDPLPLDEIQARRVWLYKMFERISQGDIEGNYRRSWLHEALLSDYFSIRKKRYWGSKQSFEWLKKNDVETYRLFERVLSNPLNLAVLKKLVDRVGGIDS